MGKSPHKSNGEVSKVDPLDEKFEASVSGADEGPSQEILDGKPFLLVKPSADHKKLELAPDGVKVLRQLQGNVAVSRC